MYELAHNFSNLLSNLGPALDCTLAASGLLSAEWQVARPLLYEMQDADQQAEGQAQVGKPCLETV